MHTASRSRLAVVAALLCLTTAWPLATADDAVPPAAPPKEPEAKAPPPKVSGKDVGQMHNVHEITPRYVRGSAPTCDADFALLAKMGVKTVVSVDGATPEVALAKKHGLRYVHVPIGYGGLSRAQQVLLYKAFSTLKPPFFVHCHHGKHRGPAACAIGLMGTDGWTAEKVVAEMKLAGTAAKYTGLYAIGSDFVKPTNDELSQAGKVPEITPAAPFTQAMVDLDDVFDRMKAVRKAAWAISADHPDVDPKHEAVILAEAFREMARRDVVATKPPDFAQLLTDSEAAAWELSKALEGQVPDATRAEAAFKRIEASCTACHTAHRDAIRPALPPRSLGR